MRRPLSRRRPRTLLGARPVREARAAETAVTDKGAARHQPTQLAIPVARATRRLRPSRPPRQAGGGRAAQKPGPTFTAAKPSERLTPTYSAAEPGPPAAARSPRPRATPGIRPQRRGAGLPAARGRRPTPFPPSGAIYRPPASTRARRSPTPTLPGSTRRHGRRPGGTRAGAGRQILWLVVAVIIAAAIGVGAALALNRNNKGRTRRQGSGVKPGHGASSRTPRRASSQSTRSTTRRRHFRPAGRR